MNEMIELRWIDPKERLPGLEQRVITRVAGINGGVRFNRLWKESDGHYHWSEKHVLAWWPIPEVPDK